MVVVVVVGTGFPRSPEMMMVCFHFCWPTEVVSSGFLVTRNDDGFHHISGLVTRHAWCQMDFQSTITSSMAFPMVTRNSNV